MEYFQVYTRLDGLTQYITFFITKESEFREIPFLLIKEVQDP